MIYNVKRMIRKIKNLCLLFTLLIFISSCKINPEDLPKYGLSAVKELRYNGSGSLTGYTEYYRSEYGYFTKAIDYNGSHIIQHIYTYQYLSSGKMYRINVYDAGEVLQEYKIYTYDSVTFLLYKITTYNSGGSPQSSLAYYYDSSGKVSQKRYYNSSDSLIQYESFEYNNFPYPITRKLYNASDTLLESTDYRNVYNIHRQILSIYSSTGSSTVYYYMYYGFLSSIEKYDNSGVLIQKITYLYG